MLTVSLFIAADVLPLSLQELVTKTAPSKILLHVAITIFFKPKEIVMPKLPAGNFLKLY
jgi:hypothetical protein